MQQTVLISLSIDDLKDLITTCVSSCLKHTPSENTEAKPPDVLLTSKEAAKILSLSVHTIYGKVHRQEIPHSKKGKRLYFSKQELTEWIRSGRKRTITEIEAEASNHINRKGK